MLLPHKQEFGCYSHQLTAVQVDRARIILKFAVFKVGSIIWVITVVLIGTLHHMGLKWHYMGLVGHLAAEAVSLEEGIIHL